MGTGHILASSSDLSSAVAASTLRFTTAGSVDDGKSTLIGRLLLDAKATARRPARVGRTHYGAQWRA